jgi:hypothetical protein
MLWTSSKTRQEALGPYEMAAGSGDKKSAVAKSGVENFPYPIEHTGTARDQAGQAVRVYDKSVDHGNQTHRR